MSYLKTIRAYAAAGSVISGAFAAVTLATSPVYVGGMIHRLSETQRQNFEAAEACMGSLRDPLMSEFDRDDSKKRLEFLLQDPKIREIFESRDNMRKLAGASGLLAMFGGLFCISTMDERRRR